MKAARVILPFLLLAVLAAAEGESLWSPDFRGYLSGGRGFAVGDALVVQIDASSSLSFSASSNDAKSLTLEFTGGDAGNLFSFLPQVRTGGTLSTTGKDSLSLKTQVPVVVSAINADGTAQVQGSRSVVVEGKNESITVSGVISPSLVDQRGVIDFSRVANAKLTYTTFLDSPADVLSPADLQTLLAPAPAAAGAVTSAPATGTTPAPAAAAPAGTAAAPAGTAAGAAATASSAGAAQPGAPGLTLSDARKKELLLLYLNRLIDVVFSR